MSVATESDRITVALTPKAAAALARLQDRTQLSKTDLANGAIVLREFVDAEMAAGSELILRAPDGTERLVLLL